MYAGRIVERASTASLFEKPLHPYSEGLMNAIPKITRERAPLETIEGMVPNPTERLDGCSFWPRCPRATEQCKKVEPPVCQMDGDRMVRCWLYAKEDKEVSE